MPEEVKNLTDTIGEASLRGHLKAEGGRADRIAILYPSGSEGRQGFAHRARSYSWCSEEPGLPGPPEDHGAELRCKHRTCMADEFAQAGSLMAWPEFYFTPELREDSPVFKTCDAGPDGAGGEDYPARASEADASPALGRISTYDRSLPHSACYGHVAAHHACERGVKPGVPDDLVWYRGKSIGLELKSRRGRCSRS